MPINSTAFFVGHYPHASYPQLYVGGIYYAEYRNLAPLIYNVENMQGDFSILPGEIQMYNDMLPPALMAYGFCKGWRQNNNNVQDPVWYVPQFLPDNGIYYYGYLDHNFHTTYSTIDDYYWSTKLSPPYVHLYPGAPLNDPYNVKIDDLNYDNVFFYMARFVDEGVKNINKGNSFDKANFLLTISVYNLHQTTLNLRYGFGLDKPPTP